MVTRALGLKQTKMLIPVAVLIALALVVVAVVTLVGADHGGATMKMVPDEVQVDQVGNTVQLEVWVDPNGIGDVASAQFAISFDSDVLRLDDITHINDPLPLGSDPEIDNGAGTARFLALVFPALGADQEPFPFAELTFEVIGTPDSGLELGVPSNATEVRFEWDAVGNGSVVANTDGANVLDAGLQTAAGFSGATITIGEVQPIAGAKMFMVPDQAQVNEVGGTAQLEVWVDPDGVGDIASAQFAISFDNNVLQLNDITHINDTLPLGSTPEIDNGAGTARFLALVFPALGADQEPFPFAQLTFEVIGTPGSGLELGSPGGPTEVRFEWDAVGNGSVVADTAGANVLANNLQTPDGFFGALIDIGDVPGPEDNAVDAPNLLSPIGGAAVTPPILLNWTDVSDSSEPVTYGVLVATDNAFNNLVVDQDDLNQSQFLISTLALGSYFWKVETRDGVGNQNSSGVESFTVVEVEPPVVLPDVPVRLVVGPPDVDPHRATVGEGVKFGVEIWVVPTDKTENVEAAEAYINFDTNFLEGVAVVGNPSQPLPAEFTPEQDRIDNVNGRINYAAGLLTGTPPTGNFLLATVEFMVKPDLALTGRVDTHLTLNFDGDRATAVGKTNPVGPVAGTAKEADVSISPLVLSGNVAPQGAAPLPHTAFNSRYVLTLEINFSEPGTGTETGPVLATFNGVITDRNGRFVLDLEGTDIGAGTYDVRVKDRVTLSTFREDLTLPADSASPTTDFGTLLAGDLDSNDKNDIFDFLTWKLGFGQSGEKPTQ